MREGAASMVQRCSVQFPQQALPSRRPAAFGAYGRVRHSQAARYMCLQGLLELGHAGKALEGPASPSSDPCQCSLQALQDLLQTQLAAEQAPKAPIVPQLPAATVNDLPATMQKVRAEFHSWPMSL